MKGRKIISGLATADAPPPAAGQALESFGPPVKTASTFDLNKFESNIKSLLDESVIGYGYAIYFGTTLVKAGGAGCLVWPNVLHSADRRQTLLSMSKTITATAVMRAIQERNALDGTSLTIDSLISPYLPPDWPRGKHVKEMTFKHLLTHTSGLRPVLPGDPDAYFNLMWTIINGATDEDFGKFSYANANFCLFRIILPRMMYPEANLSDPKTYGNYYVKYVRERVLAFVGLGGVNVVPTGPTPYACYYKFSDPTQFYWDPTDDKAVLHTGAGYWYMSAKEFGKFLANLPAGTIISKSSFKTMKDNNLGMYGVDSAHGRYFDHNGGITINGAGAVADWMMFPNGFTAVFLANSQGGLALEPQDVLRNAFNAAW